MAKNNSFSQECYKLISLIPEGKVSTYKEVAHALNCKAYRAVGNAMNKNPGAPIVPCHRIVCSDGALGGYAWGKAKKISMLKKEGVRILDDRIQDFEKLLHKF